MVNATDRFIKITEVQELIGAKRGHIYKLIRAEEFPAPIKIGKSSRWSLRAVSAWMDRLVAAE